MGKRGTISLLSHHTCISCTADFYKISINFGSDSIKAKNSDTYSLLARAFEILNIIGGQ